MSTVFLITQLNLLSAHGAVHTMFFVYRLICHNSVVFVCVQFLLIYRKAYDGSLPLDCGLNELARLTEINVDEVGVIGAKEFFEAKVYNNNNIITISLCIQNEYIWL